MVFKYVCHHSISLRKPLPPYLLSVHLTFCQYHDDCLNILWYYHHWCGFAFQWWITLHARSGNLCAHAQAFNNFDYLSKMTVIQLSEPHHIFKHFLSFMYPDTIASALHGNDYDIMLSIYDVAGKYCTISVKQLVANFLHVYDQSLFFCITHLLTVNGS